MALQWQVRHMEAKEEWNTLWRDFATQENEQLSEWWTEWVQQGKPECRPFTFSLNKIEYLIDFGTMTQTDMSNAMSNNTVRRIQAVTVVHGP